ncbi:MAG: ABC transporter permease [Paracoccaceae bacterium]
MIRLERRKAPSKAMLWLTPLLAVLLTMIFGGILFALLGKDPFAAIHMIFIEPFTDSYSQRQLLIKGGPLILIAVGLSLGFRAGVWNIGAEGQFIMGAIGGGAVGLALYGMPGIWVLPLMTLAGALAGFAWAMIPAFLKVKFNANEILVSLMLVYVAENFLRAMVTGALKNPDGRGFPESRSLAQYASAEMPMLIKSAGLNVGGLVAIGAVVLAYTLLARHRLGYQIKLTGQAPRAARFSGVKPGIIVAATLGISGALAGMAGLFELVGPAGKLTTNFPLGYGFTAIIVAFLGRLNPIGIFLAGILMAATYVGGETVQFALQVPAAAIRVFQGMLLFFLLAVDVLVAYRFVLKKEAK